MLKNSYKKFIENTLKDHPVDLSEKDMKSVFKIFESFLDIATPRIDGEEIPEDLVRAVADTVMFSVTNVLSLLQKVDV